MGSSFARSVGSIVGGVVGGTIGFFAGGPMGAVAGATLGFMAFSTIEGAVTGRLFSSPTAFLFEPTRAICNLLGITDKDITQGSLSVTKVFHENQYKNTLIKNNILRNKDDTGIVKYFYDFAKVGQNQFDKYYHKGKFVYTDGLPDASIASSTVKISTIKKAIKASINKNVEVDHVRIGYPDDTEWAQWTLQNQGIYSYATDEVIISNRKYEISSTSYNSNTNKISISLKGVQGNHHNTTRSINPPAIHSYYIVVYHLVGDGEAKMWIHKTDLSSLGVNFKNENPDKMVKDGIDCLPMVCLRNDKIDVIDAENNSKATSSFRKKGRYAQAKKLLSGIGLSIDDITKQYKENKSINDVYDIYFLVGLSPAQTRKDKEKDPEGNKYSQAIVAKYLYTVVSNIYDALPCVQEGQPYFYTFKELPLSGQVVWAGVPLKYVKGKKGEQYSYTMEIGNSAKKRYRVILQRLSSYKGSKQQTDYTYDSEGYATWSNTYTVYEYAVDYVYIELASTPITPKKIFDNLENMVPFYPDRSKSTYARSYTAINSNSSSCQFPATVQTTSKIQSSLPYYRILRVIDRVTYDEDGFRDTYTTYYYDPLSELPKNTALSLDEYVTVCKEPASISLYYQYQPDEYKLIILRNCVSFYATDSVGQGLLGNAYADKDEFVFPLSYQGLSSFSIYDKTKLLSESFYMLFFAKQTTHLEFYQTPEFASFLKIVGVCIVVVVQIFTWWSGPAASLTVSTVIESLVEMVAVYVGVTLALKVIAAVIPDSTLKAVLSAAVMVAAIAIGGGFNNFDLSTAVQLAEVPAKAIDIYTKDQMKYLNQDMEDLQERYKNAKELIDKAEASLHQGLGLGEVMETQQATRAWDGRLMSRDEYYIVALTCPDLYDVCQNKIDRDKSTDLDVQYPLYDM